MKYTMAILVISVLLLSGCNLTTNRFDKENSDKEYDYREMYLNNDTMDLTDKDLEAFNEATRIY
ncbi:MAG: hypothetical protein UF228_07845, partial [Lachnospiraceae bacterium]|nr:hypothetical protein [Lachnospiraceae bacterium]